MSEAPDCDAIRPRLGELLLGAVEEPEPLLEHVADCAACARELAALDELDAALSAPRPAGRRWAWALACVLAAAAALTLGSRLPRWLNPPPPARVLEGSARGPQGRSGAGAALATGRVVAGAEGLTLRLADGSAVYAAPGAALSLTNTRALRLHRGRARFSVVSNPELPFRVETPRGPVRVLGTVFDVHVEEVIVAGTGIKAAGLAVVVGVSVLTGAVLFGEDGRAVEVGQGQAALADDAGVRRVAVGAQALEAAQEAQAEAEAAEVQLSERNAALEAEKAALEARVAELEAKLAGGPAPEQPSETPLAPPARRVFTFGDPSPERAKLAELDWEIPAKAVGTMLPLLAKVRELRLRGESPSQELQIEIYKANSKLVEAYIEVKGKLPTHAQTNGEYVHPAFLATLLDAYLESAGLPLDEGHRAQVDDLGRAYEAAWAQAQLGYTDSTVLARKLADEIALKAEFRAGVDRVLSPQQLAALGDEQLRHVSGMDLFSPVLVFTATTRFLTGSEPAELLAQLQTTLGEIGIDPSTPGVEPILDDWLAAALGPPVPQAEAWAFTLSDGLRALRAQVDAFETLSRLPLADEQRQALVAYAWTVLPRLTTPE